LAFSSVLLDIRFARAMTIWLNAWLDLQIVDPGLGKQVTPHGFKRVESAVVARASFSASTLF
jgi:hypothetical protein